MTTQAAITHERYRPWWPAWLMGTAAGLLVAVTVSFTLVTSVQRADRADQRAERAEARAAAAEARAAEAEARDDCYALYGAAITDTARAASSALNDLVAVVAQQTLNPLPDDQIRTRFEQATAALEDTNQQADQAVTDREEYLADGRPLPCPLNPEENP